MMPRGYRFIFFDQYAPEPAAVFRLHLMSDAIAVTEAHALLAVSTHTYVEVWRGTKRVHRESTPEAPPSRANPPS